MNLEKYIFLLIYIVFFEFSITLLFFYRNIIFVIFWLLINTLIRYLVEEIMILFLLENIDLKNNNKFIIIYLLHVLSLYLVIFLVFTRQYDIIFCFFVVVSLFFSRSEDFILERIRLIIFLFFYEISEINSIELILMALTILLYFLVIPNILRFLIKKTIKPFSISHIFFFIKIFSLIHSLKQNFFGKILFNIFLYLSLSFFSLLFTRYSFISFLVTNIFLLIFLLLEQSYLCSITDTEFYLKLSKYKNFNCWIAFLKVDLYFLTNFEDKTFLSLLIRVNKLKANYNLNALFLEYNLVWHSRVYWAKDYLETFKYFKSDEDLEKILVQLKYIADRNFEKIQPLAIVEAKISDFIFPLKLNNYGSKYQNNALFNGFKTKNSILPRSPLFYLYLNYFLLHYF